MIQCSLSLPQLLKPTTAQRCRSETEKFILEHLFSSVLQQIKKNNPSENRNLILQAFSKA